MQLRELIVDIEAGRIRKAVAILYRQEVLGESPAQLAAEAGTCVGAMRMQRDRSAVGANNSPTVGVSAQEP
jgi:hypothetical protein